MDVITGQKGPKCQNGDMWTLATTDSEDDSDDDNDDDNYSNDEGMSSCFLAQ